MPRAPRKPKTRNAPRPIAARYGIAEWYGRDIAILTPAERQAFGQLAVSQITSKVRVVADAPPCPFLSSLIPGARCHKRGGVCSIQKYGRGNEDRGVAEEGGRVVTTCPSRFVQDVDEGKSIFVWISEKMLDVAKPIIVKETPFLRKVSDIPLQVKTETAKTADEKEARKEEEKRAGRIDWLVVNPTSVSASELEWAAIETQALYFSGGKMIDEFEAYAAAPSPVLFPVGKRRPDYRSSGPKRLSPQLDVKVPVLINWGKKVAVVIDRYFFENMNTLSEVYTRGDDRDRRDNASIVWFVVDYDESRRLRGYQVHYTNLASSMRALSATEPLEKSEFTSDLKGTISDPRRANKVFRVLK